MYWRRKDLTSEDQEIKMYSPVAQQMFMQYHAINKSCLCLLLLLLLPSYGGTSGMPGQKTGTLVGTMSFVTGSPKTGPSLGDAANVTVELEYKGLSVCLVSND